MRYITRFRGVSAKSVESNRRYPTNVCVIFHVQDIVSKCSEVAPTLTLFKKIEVASVTEQIED